MDYITTVIARSVSGCEAEPKQTRSPPLSKEVKRLPKLRQIDSSLRSEQAPQTLVIISKAAVFGKMRLLAPLFSGVAMTLKDRHSGCIRLSFY